jgi:hypothetical protein
MEQIVKPSDDPWDLLEDVQLDANQHKFIWSDAERLTSTDAKTLPVMVASQSGSQGIDWRSMAALSTAAIAPLVFIGIFLERCIVKGLTAGAIKWVRDAKRR